MTIEYKDSKRIVALSTESLLTSSDYTSGNFTTVGSTVTVTNNSIVFSSTPSNSDNGQYKQITALEESDVWSIDFKVNQSSGNTYDCYFLFLSATDGVPYATGNNIIKIQTQGTGYMRWVLTKRVSGTNTSSNASNNSYSYNTDYYGTLSSDGTNITLKIWTSSARSGSPSVTLTVAVSGVGTMNYIQHRSRNSGDSNTWSGTVSEVALSRTPAKPTDVQDNSLLIEKDTANRYWFSADNSGFPTNSSNYPDGNNGTNGSRIDIPTTGLTSLTDGSVAFWVYPLEAATDVADFVVLSGSDSGAASTEMIFGFIGNTSKVGIHARSGGSWLLRLNAGSLPKSQWSHVVYTNSTSSGNKVYVNGTEVTPSYTNGSASSNVFFNNVTTNTFTIGANKDSGGYQWGMEGNVQQVLIYNTTLSASDVTTLYNSGNYNSSPSSTGLLRRYELTSDVNDSSGNSQNGTATSISFTSVDSPTPATWTKQLKTPTNEDLEDQTWTKSTSDLTQGDSYIQWENMTGGTENGYYDLGSGSVSDTKWVLRAKLTISSYSTGTNSHSRWCGFGLSSSSSTFTGTQDSINIILRTNSSSDTIAVTRSNGTSVNGQLGTAGISGVTLGNGTFYLELIRESDSDYKLYVRSGSHTGTLLGTGTYTNASGVTGLRYIKTDRYYQSSSANGDFVAKWENIDFWNGVTEA